MDKEQALVRLKQAVAYLRDRGQARNQKEIATLMGEYQPTVAAALNGYPKRLSERFLRKFASAYADYIDEHWLLTGEGKMKLPDKSLRPHFGVKVAAGFITGIIERYNEDDMRPKCPWLPEYDFTITTEGDSMTPKIESGDILACRITHDNFNPPINKICVLDTNDGAVVKVLKAVRGDDVIVHSLNPDYADYPIPASNINHISVVVGLVRPF